MQSRKKVRPSRIELAKDDLAIDIHYETQELAVGADGQELVQSVKQGVKRLRLQLPPGADLRKLAAELVAANKLIHPSRTGEVEHLLQQALARQTAAAAAAAQQRRPPPGAATPPEPPPASQPFDENDRQQLWQRQQAYMRSAHPACGATAAAAVPAASMDHLDEYIEALYEEDMGTKVVATACIAQLFREGDSLAELQAHPTLLQTLSRLLRDDYKKSSELCLNLVSVFFSLSHFAQFHSLLVQNQVGSLVMEIVDLELRRCEHWEQKEGVPAADVCAKQRQDEVLSAREDRLAEALARQEPLLYCCTYLLLNMAEDSGVEQKMLKKNLLGQLCALLCRANLELLVLVTTFLRKLSIYGENKQRMAEAGLVARLVPLVKAGNAALLASVLRLLHNLAFDDELRLQMVHVGMIPKVVDLLSPSLPPELQPLVLGVLYQLSTEDKFRSMFLYTDALARVHDLVMACQGGGGLQSYPELAALAVNLAQNARVAEELARSGRVEPLLQRALAERDPLVWKMLRNISQHESLAVKLKFAGSMRAIVALLLECDGRHEHDLFLEVLGCLANLDIPAFDYAALLAATGLHDVLARHAAAAATPDDVLLEVVMATGVLCADEATASLLVEAGLVEAVYSLMLQKMEDEEFVLQTTAASHALLLQLPSRAALLAHPEVVARFTELLQHSNREVVRAADRALDAISDLSGEWEASIRRLKFEQHNRDWLNTVGMEEESLGLRGGMAGGDDCLGSSSGGEGDAYGYGSGGPGSPGPAGGGMLAGVALYDAAGLADAAAVV